MNAEWCKLQRGDINIYVAYKHWSFHIKNAAVPNPTNEFCFETIWEEKANS